MTLLDFWYSIEELPIAIGIGGSWWFPLLESIHVLAAVTVLGSVLMADLRLVGLAARDYSSSTVLRELLPWTWTGFVVALLTGISLFIVRPSGYAYNTAFIIKMMLLVLAGLNMLLFHFIVRRFTRVNFNATQSSTPFAAKVSGGLSLLLWLGIMLSGRWIGHLL